jgi:hypothetical protein
MNTTHTASSARPSSRTEIRSGADDGLPSGAVLLLALLVGFTAIVGFVFYLASHMPT